MKKYILLLAIMAFTSVSANAQRHLAGQRGIQLSGGLADGFSFKNKDGAAFWGNVSLSQYNKKGNKWVFGGEYFHKRYEYDKKMIPVEQYTLEGGYYLNFLSDVRKMFFFSLGGSALGGYETLNGGKTLLHDGAILTGKDGFIYGGALTFDVEVFITNTVIFIINARERAMFGSNITKFHFQAGVGVKFIIN